MPKRKPSNTGTADALPEAELEVLVRLHEAGEAEASEIRRRLEPMRPLSHASVMTLLGRLEEKGLVTRRKADVGKAFVYTPTRSPEKTYQGVVQRVLERVFANDPVALVSSLFGARAPNEKELQRLSRLIEEMASRSKGEDS